MRMRPRTSALLVVCLLACVQLLWGKGKTSARSFELNRTFSNDMVLQRGKPVKIWGAARKGDTITVSFAGQKKSAKADESGRWVVTLDSMPANTRPQTLTATLGAAASAKAARPTTLTNILVGDVFLFARQSSIDVSLGTKPDGKKAAAAVTANKSYRFIRIKTTPSRTPLDNLKPKATRGWQTIDRQSALTMSAAAFYLGRDLADKVDVPIGIVDLDMGYHFAGAWLSEKGLEEGVNIEGRGSNLLRLERDYLAKDCARWDKGDSLYYVREYMSWKKHAPQPYKGPLRGMSPIEKPQAPKVCYNAVIHPLRGMALKGMLLQLGNDYPAAPFTRLRNLGMMTNRNEVHTANHDGYDIHKVGKAMTPQTLTVSAHDLRRSLGDESLPLAWILPPGSDVPLHAALSRGARELQRRAQAKSKAIDLILPGTAHIPMSCQPADEILLARRCKQWVLATFYGAKGPASGPVFDRVEFKNGEGAIFFKAGTADGLSANSDALNSFEVAGEDGKFVPCRARIEGSTVKLTSKDIPQMAYVRYGWKYKPVQGLVNSADLPAAPFNTDAKWAFNYWPKLPPFEWSDKQPEGAEFAVVTAKKAIDGFGKGRLVHLVKDGARRNHGRDPAPYPESEFTRWRVTAVEAASQAPEGWEKPEFDDSKWGEFYLPTAWPWNHVGLMRTMFKVDDPAAYKALEISGGSYKIDYFHIYLNGHLIAKVKTSAVHSYQTPLTLYALKQLKKGDNSLAVLAAHSTRHMGFSLNLFARLKEK